MEYMENKVASRRDQIALLGSFILLTLLFWTMFECSLALGAGIIWLIAVALSIVYMKESTVRHRSVASCLCLVGSIIFTPAYVFAGSFGLKVLVFFVQGASWLLWMSLVTGHGSAHRKLTDLLSASFSVLGATFAGGFDLGEALGNYSVQRRVEKKQNPTKKRSFPWGIAGGVLVAIPVLAILVPILTSADAAFSEMMSSVTDAMNEFFNDLTARIGTLIISCILALILFYPLTGMMFGLRKNPGKESSGVRAFLSGSFLVGFYGSISLICLVYLFSQISYLFNGFLGVLPDGMTAAVYARRGFFEILAFSLLSLGLVGGGILFAKKDCFNALFSAMLYFLCVFDLILIATASAKMILYMNLYGLTVKRLTVSAILLLLAVLFICLILGRIFKRFPSLPVVLTAALMLFGVLGLADPDRMVAEYNVAAWQSGKLSEVDVELLGDLSDSAIPALMKVYESDDPEASAKAEEELWRYYRERVDEIVIMKDTQFPQEKNLLAFNYARYRATEEINEFIRLEQAE